MNIEILHKLCALKRLAALPLLIPGHEMIVTVERYDVFGEAKTGEELANEIRRTVQFRILEENSQKEADRS